MKNEIGMYRYLSFLITIVNCFLGVILYGQCYKNDIKTLDSLLEIAWQKKEINKDESLENSFYALNIAQKKGCKDYIGTANNYIGLTFRNNGEYDTAFHYFEKGLAIRWQIRDSTGAAGILSNMGTCKKEQGFYEEALEYLFKAAEIQRLQKNNLRLANALTNIGNTYGQEGDIEKAVSYLIESLNLFAKEGDSLNIADTKYNIATKYFQMDKLDTASFYNKAALSIYESLNEWQGIAWSLDLLAQIEKEKRNYSAAMRLYVDAIKLYKEEGETTLDYYRLVINYAALLNTMKKPEQAIIALNEASRISDSHGGLSDSLSFLETRGEAYTLLGKTDSALIDMINYTDLKDSLYNQDKATAIAEMQTKYETAEKERLASEANLKAAQATTRSRTFLALFLAALTVAAATFFYFRHRQRTAALIAQQQEQLHVKEVEELLRDQEIKSINAVLEGQEGERVRIAKDLHDRLGSMLTTVKWSFDGYMESSAEKQDLAPLAKASGLLDDAYQEVRRISHDMVSGVLTKFGLVPAVEELCSAVNASGKLQAKLVVFGMEERPDNQVEITLYRVIQELMSNILKHAKASNVTIQISRVEAELNVTVEDNGQGFDPAAVKSSGMGMKNIEARVRGINGTVFFDTGKGNGTSVMIEVPV